MVARCAAAFTAVRPFTRSRTIHRALAAGIALGAAMALAGCYEPIFREDEPRSQYDRFDAVRDQRAPQFYFDEFGNRKPNIRGRLLGPE
jgi:2-C-methyl-D-erythritol 4-phosphate cytidylyltransferase